MQKPKAEKEIKKEAAITDDDIDKLIAEAIADTPPTDAQPPIKEIVHDDDQKNKENVPPPSST